MSTQAQNIEDPVQRYRALIDQALPEQQPEWLAQHRARATAHFVASGFPGRKQEAWRYTSLERLQTTAFEVPVNQAAELDPGQVTPLYATTEPAARLVFADGHFIPALSHRDGLDKRITLGSLQDMLDAAPDQLEDQLREPVNGDIFAALNTAMLHDGLYLNIPAGVALEAPVELLYLTTADDSNRILSPRNVIVINEGASATLVEQYASLGDTTHFTNNLSDIQLAPSARLTHVRLQDESRQAFHKGAVNVAQATGSHYQGLGISLGSSWSRCDYHVDFAEPDDADCELNGLYLAGDGQLNDFHLDIQHRNPGCHSNTYFKGILYGKSRGVFDGLIHVGRGAAGTDAHLRNDNLLLSDQAEIDTKPQLEIFNDDVQCSHGTTVGQIEDEQLFYLRSRGIDAPRARQILCEGFAYDILKHCPLPDTVEYLSTRVREQLSALPTTTA